MMLLWLVEWRACQTYQSTSQTQGERKKHQRGCFALFFLILKSFLSYDFCESRRGSRLGHDIVVDGMTKDGLWDVYNDFGMGDCGEICADQYRITREEQVTHPYP